MCIAIVKPAGAWVSKEHLENSFRANPHGAGFAYFDEAAGLLKMRKGYFSFRKFWRAFSREVSANHVAIMHFRIATAGKTDVANAHPFMIDAGALMHNGPCLNRKACKGDDERSDTRQFAEDFMKGLTPDQIRQLQPMIEDFIGWEKVAFLFTDGTFMIANEDQGLWDGPKDAQCWFSNSSFRGFYHMSTGKAIRKETDLLDDDGYDDWWERRGMGMRSSYGGPAKKLGEFDSSTSTALTRDTNDTAAAGKPLTPVTPGFSALRDDHAKRLGLESDGNLVVVQRFGDGANHQKTLVPTRWSAKLKLFLPSHLYLEGERMYWQEMCQGYAKPLEPNHEFIEDGELIYAIPTGHDGGVDIEHIVGEVILNEQHLKEFIQTCITSSDDEESPTESGGSSGEEEAPANTQLVAIGGDQ